ncbi:MAG TPA: UDP-N-acetyl-D-mannosamine dehydrogenase [Rhizomicrobium sp.]|jgi:UDP-N-acetyl-D-mannosaminuronic acid dehydrogenase
MSDKTETVCVVGLGYIGLPTAAFLAMQGFKVRGVDVSQAVVESVSAGILHFQEPELEAILKGVVAAGNLKAGTAPVESDIFVLAVPTPILPDHSPDLSYVFAAARSVAPVLKAGDLVVLESTSPVGTTEQMCGEIAKLRPDLVQDGKLAIDAAHCPERVLPGQIVRELLDNDRIVGGVDAQSTKRAAAFYRAFARGTVHETDARTAELAKLTENAFRDVNIAFANELSIVCDKLDINVWRLIELANCHPRVNILKPGPGVGGHCIAVDPWFIHSSAPEEARLIRTAREINDGKRDYVVAQVRAAAAGLNRPRVACLGLTFKANVDDIRESPALHIVEELAKDSSLKLVVCDPMLRAMPKSLEMPGVRWNTDFTSAVADADIIVLLVDHDAFKELPRAALERGRTVDTRGLWAG